jgi:hypothetical protein
MPCAEMILGLGRAPARREAGHERRGADHPAPEPLHQLHHAPGHPVQVRHGIVGGDFHRHGASSHQRFQGGVQFFPPRVGHDPPRELFHFLQFDPMRDRGKLAISRQCDK